MENVKICKETHQAGSRIHPGEITFRIGEGMENKVSNLIASRPSVAN